MTSSISDSLAATRVSPSQQSDQRERVEHALNKLSTADATAAFRNQEDLVKPVQRINEAVRPYGVEFELREESSRIVTRIVDRESGEVIRQIPSEDVLRIAERLPEFQGLLVRQEI